ncbi:MAG: hypothetical protein Q9227_004402 [Pyrenula ochraceoflavens]
MGKGRNRSIKALADELQLTSTQPKYEASGRCFFFNGQTDLEPLTRANLTGVSLFFNGSYDSRILQRVNFSGATVYLNGRKDDPQSCSLSPVRRSSDYYRPNEKNVYDRYIPEHGDDREQNGRTSHDIDEGRLAPFKASTASLGPRLSLDALHRFPGKPKPSKTIIIDGRVITGSNQQPLGTKSRVANLPPPAPQPPRATPAVSPLTDSTNLHPSRVQMLHAPRDNEAPENHILDSSVLSGTTPKNGLSIKGRSLRDCDSSGEWLHDRHESHVRRETPVRKRSPPAAADGGADKRPKLVSLSSQEEGEIRDSPTSISHMRSLQVVEPSNENTKSIENTEIPSQSSGGEFTNGQISESLIQPTYPQNRDLLINGSSNSTDSWSNCDNSGTSTTSPSDPRDGLRIPRESLPQASPLKNVGRFAKIQEDIVQSKVQCALAIKEAQEERKVRGSICQETIEKCRRKEGALQELIERRQDIRNDQQRLEAFNLGLDYFPGDDSDHAEEVIGLASELPLIKAEPREIVVKREFQGSTANSEMQRLLPGADAEDGENPPSPVAPDGSEIPLRRVRFNLTDVETFIESVRQGI